MNNKNVLNNIIEKVHFESVKILHKNIILSWFNENHVKEFYYGEGLKNTLHNLDLYCQGINDNGRYTFDYWLAFYNEIPFGFLITSPITGPYDPKDNYNKWYIDGKKTFTLDILIGEKSFLGKGLAHVMIKKFILEQYPDADFFIIDPEVVNTKAIHVYEKVGFKKIEQFYPAFNPKPHIMMRIEVNKLK
jgi:aminoglycoside 6'-N-acetyltransferase